MTHSSNTIDPFTKRTYPRSNLHIPPSRIFTAGGGGSTKTPHGIKISKIQKYVKKLMKDEMMGRE